LETLVEREQSVSPDETADINDSTEPFDRVVGALQDVVEAYRGKRRAELTGMPSRSWLTLGEAIDQAAGVLERLKASPTKANEREI
jgi:hypothetical protein